MNNEIEYKSNDYEKLKCIWMASQVIEYKLCDNQFDCENCMFDKVMKNIATRKESQNLGETDVLSHLFNKLLNVKYDDKIIYLKNNLIAKEICYNTFYLGVNSILNCFLDTVNSITINECGKDIFTGQQIMQISGVWGTVSLSAPINLSIYDKVGDPMDNPLKSQWFAIIGDKYKEISSCKLSQEEWNKLHERAISLVDEIKSTSSKVGETMHDGGAQIKFLHQIVGSKKYINILNSLST